MAMLASFAGPLDSFSEAMGTHLFSLGDLAVTPMLLVRIVLFIVTVAVSARITRRRLIPLLLSRGRLDEDVKFTVGRISGYLVWIAGVLIGLPTVGIELSSLVIVLSTFGIGLGLGLQKIAENFVSGMILMFERPIRIGDRVIVHDVTGTVIEIWSRVTMVRTNDNITILIPNSKLISEAVVNLTHNDRRVRFRFPIGVAYGSDPRVVEACLLKVAAEHTEILTAPPPEVLFQEFGDSSLDFILCAYTETMVALPDRLRSQVNFAISAELARAGIQIPFPQRDLHLRSIAPEVAKLRLSAN